MQCFFCGHGETRVLETRAQDEGKVIRRRRECLVCNRRFSTQERVEETPLLVRKKDGSWEAFDRNKVMNGLLKACEKRPVPPERLEAITAAVERDLRSQYEREVPSRQIGELVMDRLRAVDGVAYVRFASVYRQFQDVSCFMEEVAGLIRRKEEKG